MIIIIIINKLTEDNLSSFIKGIFTIKNRKHKLKIVLKSYIFNIL